MWNIFMEHVYGTFLWNSFMEHFYGTIWNDVVRFSISVLGSHGSQRGSQNGIPDSPVNSRLSCLINISLVYLVPCPVAGNCSAPCKKKKLF